jgi:translation initiation factor IF-2
VVARAPARGSVIESRMTEGLGATATVLVQDGKIEPGDVLLCGTTYGKVRRLLNDRNESIPFATASMPVVVSGLNGMPGAGKCFFQLIGRKKRIPGLRIDNNADVHEHPPHPYISIKSHLQTPF